MAPFPLTLGEDAVVDSRLRVRGLDGLRIVDCSVMPTIPAGKADPAGRRERLRPAKFCRAFEAFACARRRGGAYDRLRRQFHGLWIDAGAGTRPTSNEFSVLQCRGDHLQRLCCGRRGRTRPGRRAEQRRSRRLTRPPPPGAGRARRRGAAAGRNDVRGGDRLFRRDRELHAREGGEPIRRACSSRRARGRSTAAAGAAGKRSPVHGAAFRSPSDRHRPARCDRRTAAGGGGVSPESETRGFAPPQEIDPACRPDRLPREAGCASGRSRAPPQDQLRTEAPWPRGD